jgi:hypothetical protein
MVELDGVEMACRAQAMRKLARVWPEAVMDNAGLA